MLNSASIATLFDAEWYKVRNCILEIDPLEHYLQHGWMENREPSPLFDPSWYQQTYRISGINPLKHYCDYGWREGRSPHPLFDGPWYQKRYLDSAKLNPLEHYTTRGWKESNNPHPLFDAAWYHQSNSDLSSVNALRHYIEYGHIGGRSPLPLFDPIWYRKHYNIKASDPFRHYISIGWQEGLSPHPSFDAAWYCKTYNITGLNPLLHYLETGCHSGLNPSPLFDTKYYLATYPEVEREGINPLIHFVLTGEKLGNRTSFLFDDERQLIRDNFDQVYYRTTYPDVPSTVDAVEHYLLYGHKEGRNPRLDFETNYYLDTHPEVASSPINPFLHYLLHGKSKGFASKRNAEIKQKDFAKNPRVYIKDDKLVSSTLTVLSVDMLLDLLSGDGSCIVSISHDDYVDKCGGVQNVISDEQLGFNRRGWRYLHISPLHERPLLADNIDADSTVIKLRCDTELLGFTTLSNLIDTIESIKQRKIRLAGVIHHLMGHAPELISQLVQAIDPNRCVFWTHDYFTLCLGFTLLHSHATYCNNPPVASELCRTCCYGEERADHVRRITKFFDELQPHVVCPSQAALSLWLRAGLKHSSAKVNSLAKLGPPLAQPLVRHGLDRPLRVGFIGTALYHKGWTIFQELAVEYEKDQRYQFVHLGLKGFSYPGSIAHIPVQVTAKSRNAMLEALRKSFIDVVIIWSLWPETFCFTAVEAVAAGCYIVARSNSGNIDSIVNSLPSDQGCLLADENELFSLFKGHSFRRQVALSTYERRDIRYAEGISADKLYEIRRANTIDATELSV